MTEDAALAAVDSLIDMEFYMPVKEHFGRWTGDSNLIVAAALRDHEIPVAFALDGSRVTLHSAHEAPPTPTLGIVPSETDFSQIPGPLLQQCQENCGGTGGGDPQVSI